MSFLWKNRRIILTNSCLISRQIVWHFYFVPSSHPSSSKYCLVDKFVYLSCVVLAQGSLKVCANDKAGEKLRWKNALMGCSQVYHALGVSFLTTLLRGNVHISVFHLCREHYIIYIPPVVSSDLTGFQRRWRFSAKSMMPMHSVVFGVEMYTTFRGYMTYCGESPYWGVHPCTTTGRLCPALPRFPPLRVQLEGCAQPFLAFRCGV